MGTYECNYCGATHDTELEPEGVEHIVAEALLNDTEKLRQTCARWNNFFACSFENPVIRSTFVQEVLIAVDPTKLPKKGEVYLGIVETERGTIEHRWVKDGKEILRDMPVRRSSRTVASKAFDADGTAHDIQVELPFDLVTGASGPRDSVDKVSKRIEKQKQAVFDYMTRLAADPSIDPQLDATLSERGWILRAPTAVDVSRETKGGGEEVLVTDILPKQYPLVREDWVRFYLKIAWCFACKNLGRTLLDQLGSSIVLEHLKRGAVPVDVVLSVQQANPRVAEELFRSSHVRTEDVWFWKLESPSAREHLAGLSDEALRVRLDALLREREEYEVTFAKFVNFVKVGSLDDPETARLKSDRFHSMRLEWVKSGELVALVCHITLFSGIFRATAQVTPLVAASLVAGYLRAAKRDFASLPSERRIDF